MTRIWSRARWMLAAGVLALALPLAACGVTDELLEAPDPDIIDPGAVNSPEAADALRVGALSRLRIITAGGEGAWLLGGLLADEWKSGDTFFQRNETDQRRVQDNNANVQTMYRELHRARTSAREALLKLKEFKPEPAWGIAQMYFVIGFAELTLAETFCSGQPFGDASSGTPEVGPPLTTVEAFGHALANLDTALTYATGSDDATMAVRHAIQLARARVYLNAGTAQQAVTAVGANAGDAGAVPLSFELNASFSLTSGDNQIWALNNSAKRWVVGDSFDVGGRILNAIPFASSGDSRIPVNGTSGGTSPAGKSFDGTTNFVSQSNFARSDPTPILSGLDAELIRAEARLAADDYVGMMAILNNLRSAPRDLGARNSAIMPPLAPVVTRDAAIDVFFREKAFWTFGRGQRLGDLRRLVRIYGRAPGAVFPEGQFFKGGTYGTDVNFPVTVDELNNPQFTGCADRNA